MLPDPEMVYRGAMTRFMEEEPHKVIFNKKTPSPYTVAGYGRNITKRWDIEDVVSQPYPLKPYERLKRASGKSNILGFAWRVVLKGLELVRPLET